MFPNGDFDIKWGGGTSHPELNLGHDSSPLPPIGADIYRPKPRILSIFSSAANCPTASRFIPKDHLIGTSKYTKGEIFISVTFWIKPKNVVFQDQNGTIFQKSLNFFHEPPLIGLVVGTFPLSLGGFSSP
jgi:hypothetical protein